MVWLKLANAYGSLPHSLIDFALEFFYTPRSVITIHSQAPQQLPHVLRDRAARTGGLQRNRLFDFPNTLHGCI